MKPVLKTALWAAFCLLIPGGGIIWAAEMIWRVTRPKPNKKDGTK